MKIAVVIWEDRHCDTTVDAFVDTDEAVAWAKERAKEYCRYDEDLQEIEITQAMKQDGWVYAVDYSCENDGLTVVEVELKEK